MADFFDAEGPSTFSAEEKAAVREKQRLNQVGVDAPAEVLQRLRGAAVARGEGRLTGFAARKIIKDFGETVSAAPGKAPKRRWSSEGWDRSVLGGYSGAGKDYYRDPQPLGSVVRTVILREGWKDPVAVSSVLARWDEIVGPSVAQHSRPEKFENAEVVIRCDSTNYATYLRTMQGYLQQTFDQKLGSGIVTRIRILGPSAPSWKKGPRVAPGGRGPRDTYG